MNANNACHSCITAAAGTCIGHDQKNSYFSVNKRHLKSPYNLTNLRKLTD